MAAKIVQEFLQAFANIANGLSVSRGVVGVLVTPRLDLQYRSIVDGLLEGLTVV